MFSLRFQRKNGIIKNNPSISKMISRLFFLILSFIYGTWTFMLFFTVSVSKYIFALFNLNENVNLAVFNRRFRKKDAMVKNYPFLTKYISRFFLNYLYLLRWMNTDVHVLFSHYYNLKAHFALLNLNKNADLAFFSRRFY